MVEHLVLLQWKQPMPDEFFTELQKAFQELLKIPGVLSLTSGKDISNRAGKFTYGAVVRLQDLEALKNYGPHPIHTNLVEKHLKPNWENIMVLDYEI
jgi:hypothetical protein